MKCSNCSNQLVEVSPENDEGLYCNSCNRFYFQRWLVYVNVNTNEYYLIYTHHPFDKNPRFPIGEWECCGILLTYEDARVRMDKCIQMDLKVRFEKLCELYESPSNLLEFLKACVNDLESDGYISDQTRSMLI